MLDLLMEAGFGLLQHHTPETIMDDVTKVLDGRGPNAYKSPSAKWKTAGLSAKERNKCDTMVAVICRMLCDNDASARKAIANSGDGPTVDTFRVKRDDQGIDVTFTALYSTRTVIGVWMALYRGDGKNRICHMYPVYVNGVWYPKNYPYSATVETVTDTDSEVRVTLQPY